MNSEETKIYREYKNRLQIDVELTSIQSRYSDVSEILARYRNILIDGFGTLYRHDAVYDDALEFLEKCRQQNKEIRLVTNTSSQSTTDLAHQLQKKGLDFHPHEIISSGSLLKEWAQAQKVSQCFHLGKDSALPLFVEAGIDCCENPASSIVVLSSFLPDRSAMDLEMEKAKEILRRPNSLLVTLNPDAYAPKSESEKIPVSGHFSRVLIKNTQCHSLFLGKPFPLIFTKAIQSLIPSLGATVMIGDTVGTDIMGAAHIGIDTALLLRGNTAEEEMREDFYQLGVNPHLILPNLK